MTLTSLQPFGSTELLVCFEFDPGEPAGKRGSSSDGPATPATVIVTGALMDGEEQDASLFAPAMVEKWANLILAEKRND